MIEPMKLKEAYVFKDETAIEDFCEAYSQNRHMVDALRSGFVIVEEHGNCTCLNAHSISNHDKELTYIDDYGDTTNISISPSERKFFVLRDKVTNSPSTRKI